MRIVHTRGKSQDRFFVSGSGRRSREEGHEFAQRGVPRMVREIPVWIEIFDRAPETEQGEQALLKIGIAGAATIVSRAAGSAQTCWRWHAARRRGELGNGEVDR